MKVPEFPMEADHLGLHQFLFSSEALHLRPRAVI